MHRGACKSILGGLFQVKLLTATSENHTTEPKQRHGLAARLAPDRALEGPLLAELLQCHV